jgi:hypothetical protein
MRLYHFTHKTSSPAVTLDPHRVGENPWTQGDAKSSRVPRVYFYPENVVPEHWVSSGKRYFADIPDHHIYALDKDHHGIAHGHVDDVLNEVKRRGYKGVKYYGGQIVAMLEPVHAKEL